MLPENHQHDMATNSLFIVNVDLSMDTTSYQCYVTNIGMSDIGILQVISTGKFHIVLSMYCYSTCRGSRSVVYIRFYIKCMHAHDPAYITVLCVTQLDIVYSHSDTRLTNKEI